jgi:hypothetical protein
VNGCQAPVSEIRTLSAAFPLTCAICAAGRFVIASTCPPASAFTRAVSSAKSMITTSSSFGAPPQ